MDSFEVNRILAAGLLALLAGILLTKLSDGLISPSPLEKSAYPLEVAQEDTASTLAVAMPDEKAEPIEPLLAMANVEHGKEVAKKCLQCHTFERKGAHRVGPNLWGVLGSKVARFTKYPYSTAFKNHGGTWDYKALNDYLYHPQKHIPGTKMAFAGIKKTRDRADLIAYLRTLSEMPLPLPKGKS